MGQRRMARIPYCSHIYENRGINFVKFPISLPLNIISKERV